MQQMQPFTDAYQSRCAGIGNLGISSGLSAIPGPGGTVHGNNAYSNFNNYMHHGSVNGEAEARGMTRIVFNGNNRNDFQCGIDSFQNCITGEILDNTGTYQLNFLNANGNMRYMRQQVNPSFHGDGQMQRCYVQRPQQQGQQARFVRVQGSKMRSNLSFRNFNNNQQRQKQNRRFITKGFHNNYKTQKGNNIPSHDTFEDVESSSSPKRCIQQQQFLDGTEQEKGSRKLHSRHSNHESPQQKSTKGYRTVPRTSSTKPDSYNHSKKASSRSPLLEPKVEYCSDAMHDLSYDDVSENSDDNDDSDLRERLMRKKQIIKREPGELDSDDDEAEALLEKGSNKRKSKKRPATDDNSKRFKNSGKISSNEDKSKETIKTQKYGKRDSEKVYLHETYSSSYSGSGHDNRFSPTQSDGKPTTKNQTYKSNCSSSNGFNSTDAMSGYPEAEVAELKEKVNSMKQTLRETQDKLLETNVVGSKRSLRMQEEIAQLKKQLDEAAKTENELKISLKNAEDELSAKNAELTKISVMNEVEKQEKVKLSVEINRTYKQRLAIEVEKLRALFDVEVAKMQAFYLSSNIYDDDTNIPLTEASSDDNQQNQDNHSPQNEMSSTSADEGDDANMNQSTVDTVSHREYPFYQTYFNALPHTSTVMPITGTSPFSLFENVMAYNSLIHHQHIYAQTPAVTGSASSSDATGSTNNCSSF